MVKRCKYPGKELGSPKLTYCSIGWNQINMWCTSIRLPTQLDYIALTIVTLAFTTVRRVGSFLPKTQRETETFPYILPRFIVSNQSHTTLLIWLPISKMDPEGRLIVFTVKSSLDGCCPIKLIDILMQSRSYDEPLFTHLTFYPTQAWLLKWMRNRMANLGKDPR